MLQVRAMHRRDLHVWMPMHKLARRVAALALLALPILARGQTNVPT